MSHNPLVFPRKRSEGHGAKDEVFGNLKELSDLALGEKPPGLDRLHTLPCGQTSPAFTASPLDLRAARFWTSPPPPCPSSFYLDRKGERKEGSSSASFHLSSWRRSDAGESAGPKYEQKLHTVTEQPH